MLQRLRQVLGGVQYVGGHDNVVIVAFETLRLRVFFDVQRFVFDERISGKSRLRLQRESGRNIGKDILGAVCRQMRQQKRAGSAGPGADLQNPDSATLRQRLKRGQQGLLEHSAHGLRAGRIAIQRGQRRAIAAGK